MPRSTPALPGPPVLGGSWQVAPTCGLQAAHGPVGQAEVQVGRAGGGPLPQPPRGPRAQCPASCWVLQPPPQVPAASGPSEISQTSRTRAAHRSADRDTESHHPDPETAQPPAQPPSCGNKLGRARSGSRPAGRGGPAGVRPLAVWASAVDSWLARGLQGAAIPRGCRESGLGLSDGTGVLLPRAPTCPGHLRERWDSGYCGTRECGPVNVLPSAVAPGQGGVCRHRPAGRAWVWVSRGASPSPVGGPGIPSRAALRRTTPGAARAALEPKHRRAPRASRAEQLAGTRVPGPG